MGQTKFTIYLRHETRALNISGDLRVVAVGGKGKDSGYDRILKGLRDLGFRVTSDGSKDAAWTEESTRAQSEAEHELGCVVDVLDAANVPREMGPGTPYSVHGRVAAAITRAALAAAPDLLAALKAVSETGDDCPMCDRGRLRNPQKTHWPECPFGRAQSLIAKVENQRVEPYPPFQGTDVMDGDENRP